MNDCQAFASNAFAHRHPHPACCPPGPALLHPRPSPGSSHSRPSPAPVLDRPNPLAAGSGPYLALVTWLIVLFLLAGCGGHVQHARVHYAPSRYYPPPGPASDPWAPYIHEASGRFGVPELWIRRVMRQESGGQEDVISWAGAMGLMQVMPDTYQDLQARYALGSDPFDPHNNILAGTAYLREMYDRFGAPGFLAAYNAGPNRLDSYLNNGKPLPEETVNYVASIAPLLGPQTPMSGPLAVYAGRVTQMAAAQATPGGCDPDAAYNPNRPCTPLRPAPAEPVIVAAGPAAPAYPAASQQRICDPDAAYDPTRPCQPMPTTSGSAIAAADAYVPRNAEPGGCDPDAAYDPARRCQPLPAAAEAVVAQALPQPRFRPLPAPPQQNAPLPSNYTAIARPIQETMAQPVAFAAASATAGRWAVQVGAFASLGTAQAAAENARSAVPDILRTAKIELPPTTPFGHQVAFRARLFGLSASASADACARLVGRGIACITVPPTRDSF